MQLQHRHVFVGGGVEDDFGPLVGKHAKQLVVVDDRYQCLAKVDPAAGAQLFCEVEQPAFVDVDHDQPFGAHAGKQPAQLGTDGARSAGHHDDAIANLVGRHLDVDLPLVTPNQVVGRKLAQT